MFDSIVDAVDATSTSDAISILVLAYLILSLLRNWTGTPLEKHVAKVIEGIDQVLERMATSNEKLTESIQESNERLLDYVIGKQPRRRR